MAQSVDVSKVSKAIQSGLPIVLTTYTFPVAVEAYTQELLKVFLSEINQPQMIEALSYCFKELVYNAKKANTKRVYFEERQLDINNPDDYAKGMEDFKKDTLKNQKYYHALQKKKGLYIKILLQTKNNKVKLEIRNKAELSINEYKRIHDKITRAQQFDSVENMLDESEGAGLGLIMMILILRKIGLTDENYQVLSENGETITRLILPFSLSSQAQFVSLSREFVDLIKGLPEFPENINAINRLINDPDSSMTDIARRISSDVSLTGELLKMVNSAAFSLASPCHSVEEAVKFAGIRGIRNLLFSIGSMKSLMVDADERKKALWDHSYKVAFYSYNLARSYFKDAADKEFVDDSYVCGLLHDIGKIIFVSVHKDIYQKMQFLCSARGISNGLFERMVAGVNHGEVGALVSEKWNFPANIINVIRYHHELESCPKEVWKLSALIHFADLLAHYPEGTVDMAQFDLEALKMFNIKSEEQIVQLSDRFRNMFRNGAH